MDDETSDVEPQVITIFSKWEGSIVEEVSCSSDHGTHIIKGQELFTLKVEVLKSNHFFVMYVSNVI